MMTDNKNLVIRSEQHLMVQVEAANTRLAISSQLTQDVERRRFVEVLKGIGKEEAVNFLSKNAFLNEELIERFEDKWDYNDSLPKNEAIPWSIELISKYKNKWGWDLFSSNKSLPWSIELFDMC